MAAGDGGRASQHETAAGRHGAAHAATFFSFAVSLLLLFLLKPLNGCCRRRRLPQGGNDAALCSAHKTGLNVARLTPRSQDVELGALTQAVCGLLDIPVYDKNRIIDK